MIDLMTDAPGSEPQAFDLGLRCPSPRLRRRTRVKLAVTFTIFLYTSVGGILLLRANIFTVTRAIGVAGTVG